MKEIYYLYLIKFNGGKYLYIGSRKCPSKCKGKPEKDTTYMGSPTTFKKLWKDPSLSKEKYILKVVDSHEEASRIENKLIESAWEKYGLEIVLNRNSAPRFHPEVCSKGGKKVHELGKGVHGLSKEQKSINGKKGSKITSERYAREFVIVSPQGEVFKGRNLKRFCDDRGLDVANVRRVLKGTQSYYKGWIRYVE